MVQWTPNRDQVLLKVILQVHNVKMDWKKLEEQMRLEGIDVTTKGLMHRITKIKNTFTERIEEGKVNPILQAKRAADGKPKIVIPDPDKSKADAKSLQTTFDKELKAKKAAQAKKDDTMLNEPDEDEVETAPPVEDLEESVVEEPVVEEPVVESDEEEAPPFKRSKISKATRANSLRNMQKQAAAKKAMRAKKIASAPAQEIQEEVLPEFEDVGMALDDDVEAEL